MFQIWLAVHLIAGVAAIGVVLWRRREERSRLYARTAADEAGEGLDVNAFLELLRPQ